MKYRVFGRKVGLRVAEVALGTGTFGTRGAFGAEQDIASLTPLSTRCSRVWILNSVVKPLIGCTYLLLGVGREQVINSYVRRGEEN
jgi:hypothetical protein